MVEKLEHNVGLNLPACIDVDNVRNYLDNLERIDMRDKQLIFLIILGFNYSIFIIISQLPLSIPVNSTIQ